MPPSSIRTQFVSRFVRLLGSHRLDRLGRFARHCYAVCELVSSYHLHRSRVQFGGGRCLARVRLITFHVRRPDVILHGVEAFGRHRQRVAVAEWIGRSPRTDRCEMGLGETPWTRGEWNEVFFAFVRKIVHQPSTALVFFPQVDGCDDEGDEEGHAHSARDSDDLWQGVHRSRYLLRFQRRLDQSGDLCGTEDERARPGNGECVGAVGDVETADEGARRAVARAWGQGNAGGGCIWISYQSAGPR